MHDFDNNTKLDGLEIYKALTHLLPYEPENEEKYKATAEHNQGKTKEEIDSMRKEDELQYYTGIHYDIQFLAHPIHQMCYCYQKSGSHVIAKLIDR